MLFGQEPHLLCTWGCSLCHVYEGARGTRILVAVLSLIWAVVTHGALLRINDSGTVDISLVRVTVFSTRTDVTIILPLVCLVET